MMLKNGSVLAIAAAIWGLTAVPSAAQDNCGALNLEETEIGEVIDEIAMRTGRKFVMDPRVQGKVTIKSGAAEVCADEAWELFQTSLRTIGFTAAPIRGNNYRIVPAQEGARTAGPVGDGKSGDIVTQIVRLRHIDAREAAANLAQIIGERGVAAPVRSGNAIILVDTAENVTRLTSVLTEIDRDTSIFRTVTLEHASAAEVAQVLSGLAQEISEEGGRPGRVSVVPVEASNSVLIRAEPQVLNRLTSVIAELDRIGETKSDLSVVSLSHSDAEEIAGLLREVADAQADGSGAVRKRATIAFHKPTNSIIINGDADIQRTLKNVIAQLDVRRAQVLVEAIIVEISDNTARELGVQYFFTGEKVPFSATNFSAAPNILPAAGAALLNYSKYSGAFETTETTITDANGVVTNSTTEGLQSQLATLALQSLLGFQGLGLGGGIEFDNGNIFGGILTAIKTDQTSHVLSTPSVVTLDNQPAMLSAGQEIPITTGEAIGDNFSNAFRTVSREQVGVILEVTPQINEGGTVTLEIRQETSSINSQIIEDSTDLITNKREITTTALVDDGEILVIGGLIDEMNSERAEKVPLLGDIPGVGNLFKSTGRSRERRNLMVFIRPTILRDRDTASAATRKKMDYIRAREMLSSGRPVSDMERLIDQVTGSGAVEGDGANE